VGNGQRLRSLIERPGAVHAALVYDAITAKLAEQAGFEAVFMSGAGVSESFLALPDGSLTLTEAALVSRTMTNAINIPLVVDSDTGYGGHLSIARAVREFELNRVAGIMIEDQNSGESGALGGRDVIPIQEFVAKIRVAAQARSDTGTIVIARTDAYESFGVKECVMRLNACAEVGAEIGFVPGKLTDTEMEEVAKATHVPLIAQAGDVQRLSAQGYKLILSGNSARVAMKAVLEFLSASKKAEGQSAFPDRMLSRADVDRILRGAR
jgi:methylisocitrate lyase